jgi:hypothetical protein
MNEEPTQDASSERPDELLHEHAPNGLLFPLKRLWWFVEKHLLWPIGDSFSRVKNALSYRSPIAYVGATLMLCVTAGAVAAAFYFYDQANQPGGAAPQTAEAPVGEETVIAPVSPPATVPAPPSENTGRDTLDGVVPDFSSQDGSKSGSGQDSGNGSDPADQELPATVVRPSSAPDGGPLRTAHEFARTFVGYEVGDRKAAGDLRDTATPKLARELRSDPPRLPSNGQIPKATVMNVVAGEKDGDRMAVSVSLMRSGATSELRLAMTKADGQWLVSEVKG